MPILARSINHSDLKVSSFVNYFVLFASPKIYSTILTSFEELKSVWGDLVLIVISFVVLISKTPLSIMSSF